MGQADALSTPGGGFRFAAPDVAALARFPDSFGTRFTVCVDTEEEFDWTGPFRREARSTTAMEGLPEAHRRFANRGVPVHYLIDHPIATDPRSIELLKGMLEDGRSAIGTQLHPWVNPPFEEEVTAHNSFTANLPRELQRAKLHNLTATIEAEFGKRPTIFRMGRYGMGPQSLALLEEAGYRLDTSMRSAYDYSDQSGPDYSAIPVDAFWAGPRGTLLELPFTTMFIGRLRRAGQPLYGRLGRIPKARGLASRLGLMNRVGFTPEDMPREAALEAVRAAVSDGVRVLNFAYHSPSVVPGHTPYVRDAADLAAFYGWWDAVLSLLERLGVRPATMDEVVAAAEAGRVKA